ncbi:hypothetical protein RY831_16440 [Noviherbaspirillum sp. CPCC 100848]|uniref:Uncharacterized protein n=1 Tax=Noviherbaspirillum album TaxID=3080276 RepID=A0ABU6JAT0_9BURK|nr:hypothetical protein [Noviherbaspirillum sp. CPCC 100848]MEC4720754.1 hypothetical protein [Noviherbaspirillum sp. CPCC 100848]
MYELLPLIPVTVVAAVSLFALRESLEWLRRYRGEERKKQALRILLARECELNYWTIKSIRHIVETIREESAANPQTTFSFIFPKSGKTLFRVKEPGMEITVGSSLGNIHRDVMSKNLLDVAQLDKRLFEVLQPAYDAVSDLENVRSDLLYYVTSEDDQEADLLMEFVENFAISELERIHAVFNALYLECCGNALTKSRIR